MDPVIQTLVALIAALSVATGSPTATGASPDRPAIVAPASSSTGSVSSSSSAQSTEIKGTIQSINGKTIVVNGIEITLSPKTEIVGKLQVGAAVRVEGAKQTGGAFLAKEVKVGADPSVSNDSSKKTNGSSIGSDDKSKGSDDKKGSSTSGDKSKDKDDKSSGSGGHDDESDDDSNDDD